MHVSFGSIIALLCSPNSQSVGWAGANQCVHKQTPYEDVMTEHCANGCSFSCPTHTEMNRTLEVIVLSIT